MNDVSIPREISPREIATELRKLLYGGTADPECYATGEGRVRTIPHGLFCTIAKCDQPSESLYADVIHEALDLEIVVGKGNHAIVLTTDANFAPRGWGPDCGPER